MSYSITAIVSMTDESITNITSTPSRPSSSFLGSSSAPIIIDSPFRQLEALRPFFFCLFLLIYILTVAGNCVLCWVIYRDPHLHQPMFILLANLAANGLVGSTASIPRMLHDILAPNIISPKECVVQVFVIHTYMSLEYYILASMSVDRYLAVCRPLHYHSLMTNGRALRLNVAVYVAAITCISVIVWLVLRLDLCQSRTIADVLCTHMPLVKIACNDTTINNLLGIVVTMLTMGVGVSVIVASYACILLACFRAHRSRREQSKAMSTCVTHLGSLGVFMLCSLIIIVTPRVERILWVPPQVRVAVSTSPTVLHPLLNPVIYGLRTAQIRAWLRATLFKRRVAPRQ